MKVYKLLSYKSKLIYARKILKYEILCKLDKRKGLCLTKYYVEIAILESLTEFIR